MSNFFTSSTKIHSMVEEFCMYNNLKCTYERDALLGITYITVSREVNNQVYHAKQGVKEVVMRGIPTSTHKMLVQSVLQDLLRNINELYFERK